MGCIVVRFFMSLCSTCLFPIIGDGIVKVLLSNSMWLGVCHLSRIVFHCYVKYFVISTGTSIINLYAFFHFLVYLVFLSCTQVFFFMCGKYYIHNVYRMA